MQRQMRSRAHNEQEVDVPPTQRNSSYLCVPVSRYAGVMPQQLGSTQTRMRTCTTHRRGRTEKGPQEIKHGFAWGLFELGERDSLSQKE